MQTTTTLYKKAYQRAKFAQLKVSKLRKQGKQYTPKHLEWKDEMYYWIDEMKDLYWEMKRENKGVNPFVD